MATDRLVPVKWAKRSGTPDAKGWDQWTCSLECGHPEVIRVGQVPPKRVRCRDCGPS